MVVDWVLCWLFLGLGKAASRPVADRLSPPFTVYKRFGDAISRMLDIALIVILLPAESKRETARGSFEQLGLWQRSKGYSFA